MRQKSSHFLSSERLCKSKNTWTLPWILQELKKPLGKLAVAVDIETLEAIRFELCMSGALVTVEICVLCGWWFWSAFEMVSETLSSCDKDGRELKWAILCSLLCPEMNMMWRSGTFASESMVMADARTEWLVYIRESFAPTDTVFIISPNLLTPSGLFSYQTAFSVFTLCFGCWKNAEHDGFNFDTKTFRLANASSSSPVL